MSLTVKNPYPFSFPATFVPSQPPSSSLCCGRSREFRLRPRLRPLQHKGTHQRHLTYPVPRRRTRQRPDPKFNEPDDNHL
ncbi:hypothetical protein PIB30_010928, partial [Stylosanthes scabra]|nr:hypothetical protein [Stylosanthes scabra]